MYKPIRLYRISAVVVTPTRGNINKAVYKAKLKIHRTAQNFPPLTKLNDKYVRKAKTNKRGRSIMRSRSFFFLVLVDHVGVKYILRSERRRQRPPETDRSTRLPHIVLGILNRCALVTPSRPPIHVETSDARAEPHALAVSTYASQLSISSSITTVMQPMDRCCPIAHRTTRRIVCRRRCCQSPEEIQE
jgi:hypothetical protein